MLIQPVRNYQIPKYPVFAEVQYYPDLMETMPACWGHSKFAMSSFSAIAMLVLSGCPIFSRTAGPPSIPPVMTESEAAQIILQVADSAGVHFNGSQLTLNNISIPLHFYSDTTTTDTLHHTAITNLVFDGNDTTHHVAYEYISSEDLSIWRNLDTSRIYRSIDGVKTARDLQSELRVLRPDLHIGAFYPSNYEDELRQQVRDFIAWLRTEGVI